MIWYIAALIVLFIKLFIYAYYANVLNHWFGKSHNEFGVSGVRMLIGMAFTGLNVFITGRFMVFSELVWQASSLISGILFALLAWYIVLRIFYTTKSSPIVFKALAIGTLISVVLSMIIGFLSFIGLLSNVNFC